MPEENEEKQTPTEETPPQLSEAEIADLKAKAEKAEQMESELSTVQERAAELGFDTVQDYLNWADENYIEVEAARQQKEEAKPAAKPPEKKGDPPPRQEIDPQLAAVTRESYITSQYAEYLALHPDFDRDTATKHKAAALKFFKTNSELVSAHAQRNNLNMFDAIDGVRNVLDPKEKPKAEEKPTGGTETTETGMSVKEEPQKTDAQKREEEIRQRIAPVTFTPIE